MQDAGIWLVDASVTALYRSGEGGLYIAPPDYDKVLQACWHAHIGPLVSCCSPSGILVVGKRVHRALSSLVAQKAGDVKVIEAPNARLSRDKREQNRQIVFDFCKRHRKSATAPPIEEKDEFHDDDWPLAFDKNGQPNVVAYIPDWEEFLRTHKPRSETAEGKE